MGAVMTPADRKRHLRNTTLLLITVALLAWGVRYNEICLENVSFATGWMLFVCVAILLAFNWRKKLSLLGLGKASSWLQFHIYLGWFSSAIFLLHIDFRIPNGVLETFLAGTYVIVFFSGILGLFLSRVIPARLSQRGEPIIYEEIPNAIHQTRLEAEALVFNAVTETNSTTIADYYNRELVSFFNRPRNFFRHIITASRFMHHLNKSMTVMHPYLSESERTYFDNLKILVYKKNNLDAHFSGGSLLKHWIFFHIGLSYSLLIFAIAHALTVHAFVGGI